MVLEVVFVGTAVVAAVAFVVASALGQQPVGVSVLDGVGEVAQDVAQPGDGFHREVVGERQADIGVEGGHWRIRSAAGGMEGVPRVTLRVAARAEEAHQRLDTAAAVAFPACHGAFTGGSALTSVGHWPT